MPKPICIIDFSGNEIRTGILIDDQFEILDFRLPWKVGFRQETDSRLIACFGEAFDQLDSNHPTEVRFTTLDTQLKDITDTKILACIFGAFLEEIFYQKLPEHGHPIEAISVYVITPYQWKPVHRQQLRSAFKQIQKESTVSFLKPSNIKLRGVFSQVLCLSAHYQNTWKDILTNVNILHLFLIDFISNDMIVYHTVCKHSEDNVTVELSDILRFKDFFVDTEKHVSAMKSKVLKVGKILPISVGFSGKIDDNDSKTIVELMKAGCSAAFLEPQESATLLGAAEMIRQFEAKNVEKPLHFVCNFCFGGQLPDGKWVELVPKTWKPPYESKKAFRITGDLEKFPIHLYCGLSMSENSDVHSIATFEVEYPSDSNFTSRNPAEFILSVTLHDFIHGTFAVHFPHLQEPQSVKFVVPVLMD